MSWRGRWRRGARRWRAIAAWLCWWALVAPSATLGRSSDEPATPEPPAAEPVAPEPPGTNWLDSQRLTVEQELGGLIETFNRFFGDNRQLDAESPSTRLRLKTFGRSAQDRKFTWGAAVAASVHLPRLQAWLGNARLVLVGENVSSGAPVPLTDAAPPDGELTPSPAGESVPTDISRSRGRAELRFDVVRRGVLVFDTGAGIAFAWPPIPFARFRTHLRVSLGAGLVLRATEQLFVELGGLGAGTSTDLLVERFFGPTIRLRWEGHGVYAERTRGVEWSTVLGGEWKVHPRTGLYAGVDAFGHGTPEPALETWRTFAGVRQDVWNGSIFTELEPEVSWPRPIGQPRGEVLAITLRLQVMIDARPAAGGATR